MAGIGEACWPGSLRSRGQLTSQVAPGGSSTSNHVAFRAGAVAAGSFRAPNEAPPVVALEFEAVTVSLQQTGNSLNASYNVAAAPSCFKATYTGALTMHI